MEIGRAILRRLNTPGAFNVVPFADGRVQLIGMRLSDVSPLVDMPLQQFPELFPNVHAVIAAVKRNSMVFVPKPEDMLAANDEVYIITKTTDARRFMDIAGDHDEKARHVVIIGGGKIGAFVAKELETLPGVRVRVVEIDHDQAQKAADQLSRTVVLHGDAMDAEIQKEASVGSAQMVLCLTNDDKINILAGVLAKKLGARQAGSLILSLIHI